MKVLMLLPLVFAVAHGAALKKNADQCMRESGISRDALLLLADKQLPSSDDEVYKSFIFCLLKQMGIVDEDGEVRTDTDNVVEKWTSVDGAKEAIKKTKRLCSTQKGKTPADTADLVYRCILDNEL